LNKKVEEEQEAFKECPLPVITATELHAEMQTIAPPMEKALDLHYFLEEFVPATDVRPLLIRHQNARMNVLASTS
jgi:hypothetical protein